jgi:predicted O-methyltransferase YrrM
LQKKITYSLRFLRFWIQAKNSKGHGVHSPFVYQLIRNVFNTSTSPSIRENVETLRSSLHHNNQYIAVKDLGAGSLLNSKNQRRISDIAKHAAKSPQHAQLLARLVSFLKPATGLELGTSLGLTTAYQALAVPTMHFTSIEGCPEIAELAKKNLASVNADHVHVITGNFDEQLPLYLQQNTSIDYAFIDGNHRYEPTVRYFEQIATHATPNTVIVFDDIYWSEEMIRAWKYISAHPKVRLSLDLFFIGIVFFRTEQQQKEHYAIRIPF